MSMNTIYIEYTWRVLQNNRFVGYVVAFSMIDATRKATEKFGENLLLQRMIETAP